MANLTDRFVAALRPPRAAAAHRDGCGCRTCNPRPPIDGEEFAAMLDRMIAAWRERVIADPELLGSHKVLADRFAEITNIVIAVNAERYAIDERLGVSMAECARILGIDKSVASRRRARGVAAMGALIDRAGAADFNARRAERAELRDAQLAAVDELAAYRARRAS